MLSALARMQPGAGIIAGPLAWAISTQANYAFAASLCDNSFPVIPLVAAALVVLALAGAFASYRTLDRPVISEAPEAGAPRQMLAVVGVGTGVLFAIIVALQGAANLYLTACQP